MSRNLIQSIKDELSSKEFSPVWFFEFTDGTNWYKYTDLDVPIHTTEIDGPSGTYLPRGFNINSVNYSMANVMDSCEMTIDNLDSVLSSIFLDNEIEENTASVYLGFLNVSGSMIGAIQVFTGEVDAWELDESELRLTIGSIFTRWSQQSYGKHSASCRWKVFKGNECQYSGSETWCDRSYKRCNALSNTNNFGGFRFLPDLQTRSIWWGPIPSERRDELNQGR
jgi:hypothetical protein